MNFEDLGLNPEILKAIAECGYTTPTPIQEKAIPPILMTRDVLGLAQTGTGKTASFILPMIEILYGGRAKARMPRSLILEPTRELASQVADNFDQYGKYHKLNKALLVGGESVSDQTKILDRGADVLIATPGRLLDLFDRGAVLLNDIKILVIDEADRMLDMGFIPDIEKIISRVPPMRQTLLFSATMPKEIKGLADKLLSNPKEITMAPAASPSETVRQSLIWTAGNRKREVLDTLIRQEKVKNAFIFCNRKRDIDGLFRWLKQKGYNVAALHGDMVQSKRYETLESFKADDIRLLICSDVAARGIDVAGVSHVFNYDVPMHADDYVHRIGRTGRAGLQGRSWTIAARGVDDEKFIKAIERLIHKEIPVETLETNYREQSVPQKEPVKKAFPVEKSGRKNPEKSERNPEKRAMPAPEKKRDKVNDDKVVGFGDDVPGFFSHR
ncbi:MAG: DNA helicase [Alphaproteobacteria bacterium CG_4_9_14_3_um_filter_47_13]|nr:MAG: DNA helicase [Alphaproteobacteria bacterium CG_4_9_14_3_um_filter_47_13]